jgi:hypothetical protein
MGACPDQWEITTWFDLLRNFDLEVSVGTWIIDYLIILNRYYVWL